VYWSDKLLATGIFGRLTRSQRRRRAARFTVAAGSGLNESWAVTRQIRFDEPQAFASTFWLREFDNATIVLLPRLRTRRILMQLIHRSFDNLSAEQFDALFTAYDFLFRWTLRARLQRRRADV
jgi:hypothetical protein